MPFPIRIIAFGRKSASPAVEIARFVELARPHCALSLEYLKPAVGQKLSVAETRKREGHTMRARWPAPCHAVALSEEGRAMDSAAFARWLEQRMVAGKPLVFNVGSAYGLSGSLKSACDETISLSRLTLAHGVALLVLVEQIYRAFTILRGHPYHKQ